MNRSRSPLCILGTILLLGAAAACAALPAFTKPTNSQMRVHYIDVGQGSAVLLEFSCGTALIDTGGEKHAGFDSTARLVAYLDAYFARRPDRDRTIDLLALTHAHIDHTRGVPTVLKNYQVRNIVDNGLERGSGGRQQAGAHARVAASGGAMKHEGLTEHSITEAAGKTSAIIDPISCSGTDPRFHALWGSLDDRRGWEPKILKNGNDSSVVFRMDFGEASFLFPGDLEDDVQGDLIEFYSEGCGNQCALDVDVYHVSHHGSHNGTSVEFLQAMSPQFAVISMGDSLRTQKFTAHAHGHPRLDVVMNLLDQPNGGVSEPRSPARLFKAARFGAGKKQKPNAPPIGSQFVDVNVNRGIYGTGWDGTVVITAQSNGTLRVDTEN